MVDLQKYTHAHTMHTHVRTCSDTHRSARARERERENSNSKTLFYKDCSLGSVKNLVLAKLLMNRYKITGIIYIHIGMIE